MPRTLSNLEKKRVERDKTYRPKQAARGARKMANAMAGKSRPYTRKS